jgi:hypothetical protein
MVRVALGLVRWAPETARDRATSMTTLQIMTAAATKKSARKAFMGGRKLDSAVS